MKTLPANQNPLHLKELKHLKLQIKNLQCALIINRMLSCVGVNANTVIVNIDHSWCEQAVKRSSSSCCKWWHGHNYTNFNFLYAPQNKASVNDDRWNSLWHLELNAAHLGFRNCSLRPSYAVTWDNTDFLWHQKTVFFDKALFIFMSHFLSLFLFSSYSFCR